MLTAGVQLTAAVLNEAFGRVVRKTATESVTSSTTLQNDNELFLSYVANASYILDGYIMYDGAASPAGDLKIVFNVGGDVSYFQMTNFAVNSNALTSYNVVTEGANGTGRSIGTNLTTTMSLQPRGTMNTGPTGGTMQLQWAQVASNVTATRILANSWLRLTRIS